MIPDDGHAVSEFKQRVQRSIDTETSAPNSTEVRFLYIHLCISLADHLFKIGYVSVFCRWIHESILMRERDGQFSDSNSPVPNPLPNQDINLTEDATPPSPTPGPSLVFDSGKRALQRLINSTVPEDELVSLVEAIFPKGNSIDIVGSLTGGDAQAFIDAMDKVSSYSSTYEEWVY